MRRTQKDILEKKLVSDYIEYYKIWNTYLPSYQDPSQIPNSHFQYLRKKFSNVQLQNVAESIFTGSINGNKHFKYNRWEHKEEKSKKKSLRKKINENLQSLKNH